MPTLITIIVPVYNRAKVTVDALKSVHDQTHRPIELIVVDDGSTDDTAISVERWISGHREADFNAFLIRHSHAGAAVARNVGLRAATSEFVAFLDSDDAYHPSFLEVMYKAIASRPDLDLVTCEFSYTDDVGEWRHRKPTHIEVHYQAVYVLFKDFWNTWNVLYRRRSLRNFGQWRESLSHGWQDRELCLRILLSKPKMAHVNQLLVFPTPHLSDRLSRKSKTAEFFWGVSAAHLNLCFLATKHVCNWGYAPQFFLRSVWFAGKATLAMARRVTA